MKKIFLTILLIFSFERLSIAATTHPTVNSIIPPVNGGTGLNAIGSANQYMGVNPAGTALGYFSPVNPSGDLSLTTSGVATVTGIQGITVGSPTGSGAVVLQANPTITGAITLGSTVAVSTSAPTISSGFGSSPSVSSGATTAAFRVNVGTGGVATSGVIGLATATNGWNCFATDITSPTINLTRLSASSTSTATLTNYNVSGIATAWSASDILAVNCWAY